jgi:hypothetical protein
MAYYRIYPLDRDNLRQVLDKRRQWVAEIGQRVDESMICLVESLDLLKAMERDGTYPEGESNTPQPGSGGQAPGPSAGV